MAMVRWEPVRDLLTLQERMNRMLDSSYRGNNEEDWALGEARPRQIQINVGR